MEGWSFKSHLGSETASHSETGVEKIESIVNNITSPLPKFTPLSEEDIYDLIRSSNKKTCSLDPLPTKLVVDCLDVLLSSITKLINLPLEEGVFLSLWKEALVLPLLKKDGLEPIFSNYRPVSNLQFISKLTESAVTKQLYDHLVKNNLFPILQSSYRKYHSTETALLKVKNDILLNMNKQHVTLLVLLDLSAAFDTIDHHILAERLQSTFGITNTALQWFSSYLDRRTQRISIEGTVSREFNLNHGIPQGSCLGPVLFVIYASRIFDIVEKHFPGIHCYADDTQLYLSFSPNNSADQDIAVTTMEKCIADIRNWMLNDKLKLNDEKTEFIIIGTPQQLSKVTIANLKVGDSSITPVSSARSLGAWFDSKLTMAQHITKTCNSATYYVYNLRRIRKYLRQDDIKTLVHALVTSRLDYCNSLLYGIPQYQLNKLQRVQNMCARLICNKTKYCHITPLFIELHWLPVSLRIEFKILLIVFKIFTGLAPPYLNSLLKRKPESKYNMRNSSDRTLLQHPNFKSFK